MTYNANQFKVPASRFRNLSLCLKVWCALTVLQVISSSSFAQVVVGNLYTVGNSNSATVSTSDTEYVDFTALASSTITQAQIYNGTAPTNSLVLQVGLYAVNGSNIPTGTALTTSTITVASGSTGWQTAALSYTLVQGTVYALQVATTTPSPASYLWRLNTGTNTTQPYGGTDTAWGRGLNTGAPVNGSQNVWLINTSATTAIGQPYTQGLYTGLGSLTASVGEGFIFNAPSTGETSLSSVTLPLDITATPTNPLTLKLVDQNGNVLDTGSLNLSAASTGTGNYQVTLNTSYTLTTGNFYSLVLYSNGSLTNSVEWGGASTTASAVYESATFEGTSAYAEAFSSQSNFSTPTNEYLNEDYGFGLNLTAVPEPSTWALLGLGGVTGLLTVYRRRIQPAR